MPKRTQPVAIAQRASGKMVRKNVRTGDGEECWNMLTLGHEMVFTQINSQQQYHLHKTPQRAN